MSAVWPIGRAELRSLLTSRWFAAIVAAGVLGAALAGVGASGDPPGAGRTDALRADSASVLLLCGLVLALFLGATAFWGGIRSGHIGLLAATGVPRGAIVAGRLMARLAALAAGLLVWVAALQVVSATAGAGYDGPLSVHAAGMFLTLSLTMLTAAAMNTVLGPAVATVAGVTMYISAQAIVNLQAAAELGRLGSANRLVQVAYNILPHAMESPMAVELQNRDAGGPAIPQFEINEIPVPLTASGWFSVLWTTAWCAVFGWLCFVGMRRRTIN